METTRFDTLTKAWTRTPRRRVLSGLVAGALGSLLRYGTRAVSARVLGCQKRSDCLTGEACVHHVCVAKCGDPFTCVNEVPDGGTGCAGANCFCAKTPAGRGVCLQTDGTCAFNADGCTKQRQCQDGEICASGCCGAGFPTFHCQVPCVG
jgi:hypothetical protein